MTQRFMWSYRPPAWLPGGHLQTIVPARWGVHALTPVARSGRERWATPDGDFIDVDRQPAPESTSASAGRRAMAPLLVLFHGLEGSSDSHYARAFAQAARLRGWSFALPHFRGCSGELNRAPRAYHSGDSAEIDWVLRRLRAEQPERPLLAVGISMGGNALAKWAGEQGQHAHAVVHAVAAVCSPLDLAAAGHALAVGFNRWVYTPMFLQTMVPKALRKWAQHPGLFSREAVSAARTLYAFDDAFTAPLHGFRNADDYWARASALPVLGGIRVPALLLNPLNDPFVPRGSLPGPRDVSASVALWQPRAGGHVGFPAPVGWRQREALCTAMPTAVTQWLAGHLPHNARHG